MFKIANHDIFFPDGKEPFPSQRALMAKCITALQKKQHALLESPKGTGKTLALLTSALASQKKAHKEELNDVQKLIKKMIK